MNSPSTRGALVGPEIVALRVQPAGQPLLAEQQLSSCATSTFSARTRSVSVGEPIDAVGVDALVAAHQLQVLDSDAVAAVVESPPRVPGDGAPFDLLGRSARSPRWISWWSGMKHGRALRRPAARMPSCATALNSSFDCEYVVSAVSSRDL